MPSNEMSATAIAAAIRSGRLSVREAVDAALARIAAADPVLNAFLAIDVAGARAAAARADARVSSGGPLGVLHGVPVAIKDLTDTAGLTTTYGSAVFRDHVPEQDDPVVARLRAAGAIVLGKTMTPEFGFGAICVNALRAATRNPWNPTLTSGGSSGGAAVAVAASMVPLGHGTDFGGSVRTPASFCGVLSLRPTPGVIASPRRPLAYDTLASHGVLARTVDDLELFLDAVAGPDPRDPTSLRVPAADAPAAGPLRIAATEDFGVAPVAGSVRGAMRRAVEVVAARVAPVSWRHPDCSGAVDAFKTLRQPLIRHSYATLVARHGEAMSPTLRWAVRQGEGIAATDYLAAEARRSVLYRDFLALFDSCDVLLAPAASVLPWPNTVSEVSEIDGRALDDVIDYLAVTFIVSLAGCPVVTLPSWTAGDLPFGIQLIGAPGSDRRLLAAARRLESACAFAYRTPAPGTWAR